MLVPIRSLLASLPLGLVLATGLTACSKPAPAPAGDGAQSPSGQAPDTDAPAKTDTDLLATYDRGLDYLASQQQAGVWKTQGYPDPGSTALALQVFLERPGGVREKDAELVSKGLDFLAASIGEDGGVNTPAEVNYITSAAVGALAASGRAQYAPKVKAGSEFVKRLQFLEDDTNFGGIGYGSDKTRSDLSNTQFALGSLRAAGINADDPVFQNALKFLTRTQNRKENETPGEPASLPGADGSKIVRGNDGGANYRPFDSKAGTETLPDGSKVTRSYGSMTYALLRCYHLCGLEATDGRVQAAVDWIGRNWTLDANAGMPEDAKLNGLYYYYMTMAKALDVAGLDALKLADGRSVAWREELAAKLAQLQRQDGSWLNEDPRWHEDMPVIVTAYSLLALSKCDG